jgi:hypothetical protein
MFLMFVLTLADGFCCAWIIDLVLVSVSGDRELALSIGLVPPEDRDRIQSPKRCRLF